jgi:hypothetical protein
MKTPLVANALAAQMKQKREAAVGESLASKLKRMLDWLTPPQRAFIDDPDQFKIAKTPRRTGKTTALAVYLYKVAIENDDVTSLYITMTRGMAKRNMWGPLKRIAEKFDLPVKWNEVDLTCKIGPSVVMLGGAETTADIDKYRGLYPPPKLIAIDEVKSFPAELLLELMEEVLTPALAETMGTLALTGTPGAVLAGKFYEASGPKASHVQVLEDGTRYAKSIRFADRDKPEYADIAYEWSLHEWAIVDNVAQPQIWENVLKLKKRYGWPDDHPTWLREYLGQWIADEGALVYKYVEERNGWTPDRESKGAHGLPEGHDWKFVLGMDLGYDDDHTFEVAAYSETHPDLFHIYDYAEPQMIVPDIAAKIRELEADFGEFDSIVGDRGGLGKAILATLEEQYGIHVEPADKMEKRDHIELLNGDLISKRVHILKGSGLANEMKVLVWDETGKKEDKRSPNHRCDGFLYLWRHVYHHYSKARVRDVEAGTVEWYAKLEAQSFERSVERYRRRKAGHFDDVGRLDRYDRGGMFDA